MFKPLKIPVKFKKINLRNRYWQAQDYHFRDYLHTFTRQLKVDVNKSFRRELYRKLMREALRLDVPLEWLVASIVADTREPAAA